MSEEIQGNVEGCDDDASLPTIKNYLLVIFLHVYTCNSLLREEVISIIYYSQTYGKSSSFQSCERQTHMHILK